jgi:3-oxoacyl-[acyl-carrier protein] reductase
MKKVIIVTGAGRGIGYQSALALSRAECLVIALSRNATMLQKLKDESGGKIIIHPSDLLDGPSSLIGLLKDMGVEAVDGLINNAGLLVNKPFEEITADDLKQSYEVNVFAPYLLIQGLLPYLKKSGKAHVLNISSMGGFQGAQKFPGLSAYSSSKGALVTLTECLAEEFRETRISVNCLCLGAVATEMLDAAFPGYKAPVTPVEMATFITSFVLNNHHFMNGRIIPVALSTP